MVPVGYSGKCFAPKDIDLRLWRSTVLHPKFALLFYAIYVTINESELDIFCYRPVDHVADLQCLGGVWFDSLFCPVCYRR